MDATPTKVPSFQPTTNNPFSILASLFTTKIVYLFFKCLQLTLLFSNYRGCIFNPEVGIDFAN